MQCPRCHFENMPGMTVCAGCGAMLAADAGLNVIPPRAGWRKRFRAPFYLINSTVGEAIPVGAASRFRSFLERSTAGLINIAYMFLSLIPGLGHWVSGRFRELGWRWGAWLAMLPIGLALFGTVYGAAVIGATVAFHAWIVYDAGKIPEVFREWHLRLASLAAIFGLLWFQFYGMAPRHLLRGVGNPLPIASDEILPGDFLLIERKAFADSGPQRGDVILYRIKPASRGNYYLGGGEVMGKVLGLPGERIVINKGVLTAIQPGGGRASYLAPEGIVLPDADFTIPAGRWFCWPSGIAIVRNNIPDADPGGFMLEFACRPDASEIQGRAFMIYNTFLDVRPLPRHPLSPARPPPAP